MPGDGGPYPARKEVAFCGANCPHRGYDAQEACFDLGHVVAVEYVRADVHEQALHAIKRAGAALSMTKCPYYEGVGICDQGCYSEPECQTGEPTGGWVGKALATLGEFLEAHDA